MLPREEPRSWASFGRIGVHIEWDGVVRGHWTGILRVFERAPRTAWDFDAVTGQPWLDPVFACVVHFDGLLVEIKAAMKQPQPSWLSAFIRMARLLGARAYTRERWNLKTRTKRRVVRPISSKWASYAADFTA